MKKLQAEVDAAEYFSGKGKEVKFLKESTIDGKRTADLVINGVEYDVKAPVYKTKSKAKIEKKIKDMVESSVKKEQADRFIVDLSYIDVEIKVDNILNRIKGNAKSDVRLENLKEIIFMKDGQIVSHQIDKSVKKSILDV